MVRPRVTEAPKARTGEVPASRHTEKVPGESKARPGALLSAWERVDARNKGSNFVKMVDLRRESGLDREAFDIEVKRLQKEGVFGLDTHEGIHSITPEEREAGIRVKFGGGRTDIQETNYIYVTRGDR
jgi:hypothetical protein